MDLEYVFRPIQIGRLVAKNRIEVSPAEPFLCTQEGSITDEFLAFTASLAASGAGIVTIGDSPVNQAYADTNHFVVNLANEYIVHGLFKVTELIHRYGALASIELNLRDHRRPHEMSREDIKGIIDDFARAAERCKKAGFDMLMLHFGHGHTLASFYSPDVNKRTDEYGCGSFENRCRLANELIDAVRGKTGGTMPIELRFSGDELYEQGVHVSDGIKFVKAVQDKIDLIHISAGSMYAVGTMEYTIQHTYMPRATNADIAAQYKAAGLKIPVVSVGSYDMELAEKALREGKADMIAMIRSFIADPEQINKARAGKIDEIRPCIRCNVCTGDDPHGCPKPLRCTVNALAGREKEYDKRPEQKKKVVIIGGGCAGMEAARRTAELGHSVVLFEKEPELGGSLTLAGANPIKTDVRRYAEWSVRMTHKTPGIEIRTGTRATEELVRAEKPDAVIVAVGSEQIRPDIKVADGGKLCFAWELDAGLADAGESVVIAGAGLTGSETAVMLAREGKKVVLIDMLSIAETERRDRNAARVHMMALKEGARILGGLKLTGINEFGATVTDAEGNERLLSCDTVALSLGVRRRTEEMQLFKDVCSRIYYAGDCVNSQGNITTAVREGFYAALNI